MLVGAKDVYKRQNHGKACTLATGQHFHFLHGLFRSAEHESSQQVWPQGDSGLTGRKIIVDTYGGFGRHGGGAFSGKDPTKVDRSAAYAARWVAKNIVAAKLAHRCEVQLAYAIGVARPVSVNVNTFGTGAVSDEKLAEAVNKVFDLRPAVIIRSLDLRRPIYRQLAAYGHMGREELGVNWEKTDKVDAILAAVRE